MENNMNINSSKKIRELRQYLSNVIIGQPQAIDAVIASLISSAPAILLGPPGTGKTTLVECLATAIQSRYAYRLLTKFTQPEELFGPIDIVQLREAGRYIRRLDNSTIVADIVMLDEIFKASSAIVNTLLDIMLFRRFFDGEKYLPVNWLAVYSASNEVPTDTDLAALYDRFAIRVFISRLPDTELLSMLHAAFGNRRDVTVMTREEVTALQQYVRSTAAATVNSPMVQRYVDIITALRPRLDISERRIAQGWTVATAIAVSYGMDAPTIDDIVDAISLIAPSTQEDVAVVNEALREFMVNDEVSALLSQLYDDVSRLHGAVKTGAVNPIQLVDEYERIRATVQRVTDELKRSSGPSRRQITMLRDIASMVREVKARAEAALKEKIAKLGE